MDAYCRIAEMIEWMDGSFENQPSLDEMASQMDMSPSSFHRLFAQWTGVTPKDFIQCLTLAEAKRRLASGSSVMNASYDVGLSGPGRLHDLCVTVDAASPGEIKAGGEGWTLQVGLADSPFGKVAMAQSPRGLCHMEFLDSGGEAACMQRIQALWPKATLDRDDARAIHTAANIFSAPVKGGGARPIKLFVKGSDMQLQVWRALLRIPPGQVVSYGAVAKAIDKPKASRAVGTAVGSNAIAYLIPCHRVIRQTGVLGGYRWGETRKRILLASEMAVEG